MFKKSDDFRERSGKTAMRKKDVQHLKICLIEQYPRLGTSDALAALFAGEVTQSKLMSKTIVYYFDALPMIYDEHGRNKLFPSVLFLFLFPQTMRTFIIHGPVSKFVLNGADLMLPGLATLDGLDGILKDERCCIRIVGNPLPFAVSISVTNWSSIQESPRKGKACEVVHMFGDFLVPFSAQSTARANAGFEKTVIRSLPGFVDTVHSEYRDDNDDDVDDDDDDDEGKSEDGDENSDSGDEGGDIEVPDATPGMKYHGADEPCPDTVVTGSNPPADWLLHTSLLLLIKSYIKSKHLPMLVSTFWPLVLRTGMFLQAHPLSLTVSRLSNPSGTAGTGNVNCASSISSGSLDVKKTPHRSALAFLQFAEAQGLLALTTETPEDSPREAPILYVASVNSAADSLRTVRISNADEFRASLAMDASGSSVNSGSASSSGCTISKMKITELLKLPKNIRDAFAAAFVYESSKVAAALADQSKGTSSSYPTITAAQLSQPMRFSDVKELLGFYFRVYGLDCESDRSSVSLSPSDGFYKIAVSAAGTAVAGGSTVRFQESRDDVPTYDETALHAHIESVSLGDSRNGTVVAGVWMPTVSSLLSETNPVGSRKPMAGGSSIGGWGVDADKVWKPTHLPSRAAPPMSSSTPIPPNDGRTTSSTKADKKEKTDRPQESVTVRKDALLRVLVGKLSQAHRITLPSGEERCASGPPPSVDIVVQVVRGNKYTTHVRGLEELVGADLPRIREMMAKKFASACSIGPCATNPKLKEIMAQGNLSRECEEFIVDVCGVPRGIVRVDVGKGVKSKKK